MKEFNEFKKQIFSIIENYEKSINSIDYQIISYDAMDIEKIHSVKRLSDGEVFTVGDEIIFIEIFPVKLKIKSIQLFNKEILIHKDCTMNTNKLSEIKHLQHYKDTTVGLYAIDFNPKELIKRFVDSQSDATRLVVEDVEDLVEDWVKFIDNKNIGKSPFFRI